MNKLIDILGEKFGRLTVIERDCNDESGSAFWICRCDCGNIVSVKGYSLRSGHTKSCGCLQRDTVKKMAKHGYCLCRRLKKVSKEELTHDDAIKWRIYKAYHSMKSRCYNKNNAEYNRYGERGIGMCKEWLDNPSSFFEWAEANNFSIGLTLERIDNDKGYSPQNCRFATRAEQNRNTSRINRVLDEKTGETLTTADVARIIGVSRSTAAKWFRMEGLRRLEQFQVRVNQIGPENYNRTIGRRKNS